MKVLSIRQPYAALVTASLKPVENRNWRTAYRGPLLIHAGLTRDPRGFARAAELGVEIPELRFGGIIGIASLADIVRDSESPWAEAGRWHWILEDARPLPFHDCRGRLGLFDRDLPPWYFGRYPAERT